MQWPHEIISAFGDALVIELQNGTPKDEIIAAMLDWAMRRTVWRAGGDPAKAEGALRSPYTPLGSVCGDGLDGRISKFTLKGDKWGPAVQRVVRLHPEECGRRFRRLPRSGGRVRRQPFMKRK